MDLLLHFTCVTLKLALTVIGTHQEIRQKSFWVLLQPQDIACLTAIPFEILCGAEWENILIPRICLFLW